MALVRPLSKRHGQIMIAEGAGGGFNYVTGALLATSDSLTVTSETGDFTSDDPNGAVGSAPDRGSMQDAALWLEDDAPITGSFSANVVEFSNSTTPSILDACNKLGGYIAANWVSVESSGYGCSELGLWDIRYKYTSPTCGNDQYEIYRNCKLLCSVSEGLPTVVSVSFVCNWDRVIRIGN